MSNILTDANCVQYLRVVQQYNRGTLIAVDHGPEVCDGGG